MYTIYRHTTPDGKIYIGCTSKTLKIRKRLGYTGVFGEAVSRYGWDRIKTEILDTTDSQEKSAELEESYIQKYNSRDPAVGYNKVRATGGMSPDSIQKLSDTTRVAFEDEAFRNKYRKAQKIAQVREETRKKKSESAKVTMNSNEVKSRLSRSIKSAWLDPEKRTRFVSSHLGKRWVYQGEKSKQVSLDELNLYLASGWKLGRKKPK